MKKEFILIFTLLFVVCIVFFYKMFLYGQLPIPADLLVSEYNPWKTYSYLGYTPASFPNKAQYFDVLRQLYPWKTLTVHQLQRRELPLWNPYNFSGAPLLSNFQSAVFYPFALLYLFFKQQFVWSFLVFLQPFLCSLFTYLYSRKLSISVLGSLFTALSFSFSSFLTVWLEYNTINHVILWLPLALLSIEHLKEKKSRWWACMFVVSIVFSSFAGHIQVFGYMLFFIVFYVLYNAKRESFIFYALLFMIALGIGCVQFIPGIELIMHSARSAHLYDFFIHKILIQPVQLVMLFVPDFFGNPATRNYWLPDTYVGKVTSVGVVALFFIAFSLAYLKNKLVKFFWIASLVLLFLVTNHPFTQFFYYIFSQSFILGSSPTLFIFLVCFSFSVLAGIGVDVWRKQLVQNTYFFRLTLLLGSVFFLLWIVVILHLPLFQDSTSLSIAKRNLLFPTALFLFSAILFFTGIQKKRFQFVIIVMLLIVQSADLFRSFQKFNPFSPQELIFPKVAIFSFIKGHASIDRFWGYGFGSIEANFATQYQLFSSDGYDPLYPMNYGEFIQSSKNGKLARAFTTQNRSDATIASGFGEDSLSGNYYRLKILDVLGVRFIVDRIENNSTEKTFPNNRFKLIHQENGWRVMENIKASPRIFLTSQYEIAHTKEDFEKLFFDKKFDPSKAIILEKKPDIAINKPMQENAKNSLKLISYRENEIVMLTQTSYNTLLFLSDTYFPGWKATIDEKEVSILKADYTFRSIGIPKGTHRVRFIYRPLSFTIGLSISIISVVFFIIFIHRINVKKV